MADLNHVVIIGGGIGGLCLAHGLQQAGVNATVYERDRAITDRLQGYRVHISPKGSRALHDCLPPALFEAFAATCGRPPRAFRMLTERMQTLISVGGFHEPEAAMRWSNIARSVASRCARCFSRASASACNSARPSSATRRAAIASWHSSKTAAARKATCWSRPTAAARACAVSTCRTRSASIPVWQPSAARCSSTRRRAAASHHRCAMRWRWSRDPAGAGCSLPRRNSPTQPRSTASAAPSRRSIPRPAHCLTTRAAI